MPEPQVDIYAEFYELVDALTAAGIPFAVCGGLAVAIHGYTRFTHHIDILILPEDEQRVRTVAAQRQYLFDGGRMPAGDTSPSDWELTRVSKIIGTELLTLDLLLVGPSIQSVWDSRIAVEAHGRTIPVVSREGLKRLKLIAGRKKDLLDIEQLGLE